MRSCGEADETLFVKMQCNQHCLNPTLLPLKPNTHGLRPSGHSYHPMSCRNVGFSSPKIHALFGLYADTYDDGAVLHRSIIFFLSDCTDSIIMHVRLMRFY